MLTDMLASALGFRNASLESPGVSLGDSSLADWWRGTSETASGVKVSHRSALTLSPLFQAINMISGDYASLPAHVYLRTPDDERVIDTESPSEYLINQQANEHTTAFDLWRTAIAHALLWGNGFIAITRAGGAGPTAKPTGLYNLLPDRTQIAWEGDSLVYHTWTSDKPRWFFHSDVIHIRGVVIDGVCGIDLIDKARDMIGTALAAQNFAAKFFKSGGRTGGILELSAAMQKGARDNVEEGFRKTYESVDNAFKTVILRDNAKFHAAQASFEDTQLVESREEEARNVARIFNIPPHKLGISGSVSYNSQEQGDLAYYKGCLRHWLTQGRTQIESKMLTEQQRRSRTHYVDHVVEKILQTDVKTTNEVLEIQRRNEIINANEWRSAINRPKRKDDGGETYINPNTKPAPPSGGGSAATPPAKNEITFSPIINMPEQPAPIVNVAAASIPQTIVNVPEQPIHFHAPEQQPPTVNVAAPIVNVPESPPPQVHVDAAQNVTLVSTQAAHRALMVDIMSRVARRVSKSAKAVKTDDGFVAWLDSLAAKESEAFADFSLPVVTACLAHLSSGVPPVDACKSLAAKFFTEAAEAFSKPTIAGEPLTASIARFAAEFERTIPNELTTFFFKVNQ